MAKTISTKRPIAYKTLTSNLTNDSTNALLSYFETEIAESSVSGLPAIVKFQLIKNTNLNLTKENGLLNLTIPIIPVCYDINSTRSLAEFIADAKEPKFSAQKTQTTESDVFEKRLNSYANKIMIYVKNELALRYALAKNNTDQKTMDLISNLDVMKNIDLELYAHLLAGPTSLIETKTGDKSNAYILGYEDGSKEFITKEQFRMANSYFRFMNDYNRAQKKMFALTKALSDYENYDITHEKNTSTVPEHSIIARGVSRTNNRVKKVGEPAKEAEKATPKKATPPKQKGEQ